MSRIVLFASLLPGFAMSMLSQIVTVTPAAPGADDTVTVIFDARHGNRALMGHEGPVYAHSGVIIGTAEEPSGWRYVQGNWGTDDARMRMTGLGNDRYSLRFHIRSFYGIPQEEPFLQLAFVFRDQSGTIVAKGEGEKDIYYPQLKTLKHGPIEKANGKNGLPLGVWVSTEKTPSGGLRFSDGRQVMEIGMNGAAVRVSYLPLSQAEAAPSEAVVLPASPLPAPAFESADSLVFHLNDHVSLHVGLIPLRISLRKRLNGSVLYADEAGRFFYRDYPEVGALAGLRMRLSDNERLYGLGSRATPMNRRGSRLYLYNMPAYGYTGGAEDLYLSVPVLYSSKGYGVFVDSYRRGYADLGKTEADILEFGVKDSQFSYYILPATHTAEAQRQYMALTGRQPMPPKWALGYIQSRFGYKNQQELLDITRRSLDAGIPISAIPVDLYWFGGGSKMGNFDWDKTAWPNAPGMIKQLKSWGIRTILVTETYMVEGTRLFRRADSLGLLARKSSGEPYVIPDFWTGPAGLLDVFHPKSGDFFWPEYRRLLRQGVAGFWCDSGEPENHPSKMIHHNGTAEAVHNLYGLYWSRMLYEGFQRDFPGERWFNLARSGYAGMQRYGVFPWSGDVSRSWQALKAQVPVMLGASLSGFNYMHSDLGGFTGGPKDEMLYTRWLQLGVFSPIMRIHGDAEGISPEPIFWSDSTLERARRAIALRYVLRPYLYSAAWQNAHTGDAILRPLWYEMADTASYSFENESFYFGDHLLVAPVLENAQREKAIYLPAGSNWYDWYGNNLLAGGRRLQRPLSNDYIPFFVRTGAVIPVEVKADIKGARFWFIPPDSPKPVLSTAIEDDGETASEAPEYSYSRTVFNASRVRKKTALGITTTGSRFSGSWITLSIPKGAAAPARAMFWNGQKLPRLAGPPTSEMQGWGSLKENGAEWQWIRLYLPEGGNLKIKWGK